MQPFTKEEFTLAGKSCIAYPRPSPKAILLQPTGRHELPELDGLVQAVSEASKTPFLFASFVIEDWNRELSPWQAPPVFGREGFGDGAGNTLGFVQKTLLPGLKRRYGLPENIPVILGGYSLAGLFSLWAVCRTDAFAAAAATSPSVWFPGWEEYVGQHLPQAGFVYLSLGDREERAKNPVMARVGNCIRGLDALLEEEKISHVLEWNEGSHFKDPAGRTARGFIRCLAQTDGSL